MLIQPLLIQPLNEDMHFQLLPQLAFFWKSAANQMLPYHHILFPRYFQDFCWYAANTQRQMLGYLYALPHKHGIYLHLLAVRAGYYRQKIASRLLQTLEQKAKEKNFSCIETYCLKENKIGHLFFRALGFRQQAEVEIRPQIPAIWLCKEL